VSGGRLLERTTVIDAVVSEIKGKIISGELKDGDMLASQDELARNLGVSRASLREALNRLSLMGLIEMKHGSGTFVRTSRARDYMNPLTSMLIMDAASAEELLQARLYIESGLAALAATNASDEDLRLMRVLVEQMRRDAEAEDSAGFVDRDARFHLVLAESARNPVLMKVAEIIRELLPAFITRFRTAFPQRVPAVVEQHARVYEAVRDRNPEAARRAMEEHLGFLMQLNREGGESR
jgi:GntR family transcriptional repressor for pyruvate dehydrogenase complex